MTDWKNEYIHIEDISYLDKNIFVNFYIFYISVCINFVKDQIYINIMTEILTRDDISII